MLLLQMAGALALGLAALMCVRDYVFSPTVRHILIRVVQIIGAAAILELAAFIAALVVGTEHAWALLEAFGQDLALSLVVVIIAATWDRLQRAHSAASWRRMVNPVTRRPFTALEASKLAAGSARYADFLRASARAVLSGEQQVVR